MPLLRLTLKEKGIAFVALVAMDTEEGLKSFCQSYVEDWIRNKRIRTQDFSDESIISTS